VREGGGAPRAVVVTVGDELLLGRTVDGNAAWLGRELSDLGIPVLRRTTVGDEDGAIQRAVTDALGSADLVVMTGGLGPTRDDRTRDAVAALLGAPLHVDPELMRALEARFRARGYDRLPVTNITQAQVPEGATVLANPQGTAPGLALPRDGRWVVLLPGVPREMKAIFAGDLRLLIEKQFGERLRPVYHRTIHTTGIPESLLAERVEELLPADRGPVSLAYLPDLTGVDLRFTALDVETREEAEGWFDRLEQAVAPAVTPFRYRSESGDLVESLAKLLVDSGRKLAVAESCTGGLIAKRLTDRAGSSAYFAGGVVAYADHVKVAALSVQRATLAAHGAVSEAVALEMARGVAERLGADASLAVTGIAGPEGGTPEKPVGTVWYAARVGETAEARREVFGGDRAQVRERAAQAALALLLRRLESAG
jgi:nicotinamide-nucleotide amidase